MKEHKVLLDKDIQKKLVDIFNDIVKEMKVRLRKLKIEASTIYFIIECDSQINTYKTLKSMQKKVSKCLCKWLGILKTDDLWKGSELITAVNFSGSELDFRIEKTLESLWSVAYYDLDESLEDEIDSFKRYLENKNLGVIEYKGQMYIVDIEALTKEINLNCFECTKIHRYGCCCGKPCDLSEKNKKTLKEHLPQIEKEMKSIDEANYEVVVAHGGILAEDGSIKECEGHCALLVEHEGVFKCMSHKYALDKGMPVYEICPLSCLMYPLEIIELITHKQKKVILLTSVLEEGFAKTFGRWGSYQSLDVDLRCINKSAHNEIFKEADYKPVYQVNQNLLIHEFGAEFYKGLQSLLI